MCAQSRHLFVQRTCSIREGCFSGYEEQRETAQRDGDRRGRPDALRKDLPFQQQSLVLTSPGDGHGRTGPANTVQQERASAHERAEHHPRREGEGESGAFISAPQKPSCRREHRTAAQDCHRGASTQKLPLRCQELLLCYR